MARLLALLGLCLAGVALSEEEAATSALALDDECAGGDDQCTLNALQHRSSAVRSAPEDGLDYASPAPDFEFRNDHENDEGASLAEVDADGEGEDEDEDEAGSSEGLQRPGISDDLSTEAPVTNCYNGTNACPLGQTCVVKYDKTWSQCMSCDHEVFKTECQKLPDYMRYAAIHTCRQSCMDAKCYNGNWCVKPYKCVVDVKAQWGQCVSCRDRKQWTASCHGWKEGLLHNAKRICRRDCTYGGPRRRRRNR